MSSSSSDPRQRAAQAPTSFDWSGRYRDGHTPWDLGGPHPELLSRLEAGIPGLRAVPFEGGEPSSVFVPGAGRGHDALALARMGFRVTASEWIAEVADALRGPLEELGGRVHTGDALAFDEGTFDLVFEHTFFCALDPADRPRWGELVRRTLAPGGRLAALVFPEDKPWDEGGPPWRTTTDDLAAALGPGFERLCDEPVALPIEKRRWAERWALFARTNDNER